MSNVEEYVDKIGRISSEYKQLSRDKALLDDDGEVSAEEIQERKTNIYKYIKRKAIKCEDKRIAVAVLEFSPKMFKYLPTQFKHDKEFFLKMIEELETPRILKYADEVIQSDLTCCLEAIRMEYRLINYISPELKKNQAILDTYSWARELHKLPKKLPDIDLSKYGPDDDDKYFYDGNTNKNSSPSEEQPTPSEENEILESLELDGATLTVATIEEKNKEKPNKSSKSIEKKPIDQDLIDEETIAWDDDEDDDDDDGISGKNIDDDDEDLPPIKSKKEKKGFFARLWG